MQQCSVCDSVDFVCVSAGVVGGVVAAVLAAVVIMIILLMVICCRKKKHFKPKPSQLNEYCTSDEL